MSELRITATADGCALAVRVHPGAKRNGMTGVHDGALKVSLSAPPADGRANAALVALLAERLGVARANVEITAGLSSRSKSVRVVGVSVEDARARLKAS